MLNFFDSGSFVAAGKNIYASTKYYNYGPVMSLLLGAIARISSCFANNRLVFKLLYISLLTVSDFMTALLVSRKAGRFWGAVFFLNPISIHVAASRHQFDSLAFMFAAYGAYFLEETSRQEKFSGRDIAGILMLSMSMITKHFMTAFPAWILMNRNINARKKFMYAFVPAVLFLMSFVPYLPEGWQGIRDNVFLYRSAKNFPLAALGVMKHLEIAPAWLEGASFLIFGVLILLYGYIFRREDIYDSFLLYSVSVVCFASGIYYQYFLLPVMALVLYPSALTLIYFLLYLVRPQIIYLFTGLSVFTTRDFLHVPMVWCLLIWLVQYYRHNRVS
ncbi:MAG: hypothetical protein IJS39_09365 [Synergistaceae bacterium]|nr:hypothetical protein [Synergistaceae bacterium]